MVKIDHASDSSAQNGLYESPRINMFLDINGTTEYSLNDALLFQISIILIAVLVVESKSINIYHRHLPGTTNLQTATIQVARGNANAGGNCECRQGF